ncbi:MAG: SDR family oxidoreductase [Rhodospirillaceae bacterium]|nr:MAG: SDR family oxidoreductase [Rhodospirillaceae bacterium]
MKLKDKIILVTGAASGLGAATAVACAREGGDVFLVDRDSAGLDTTSAEVRKLGVRSGSFVGDLGERQVCFDAVNAAIGHFGALDGLCNVAGFTLFHRVCEVTAEDWSKTIAVILSAPFHLSQAAIPELIKRRGSIVNVASSAGIKGTAYTVPYSSAKAGLIHMTKCMAMEFVNEPIRINAVAPGGMLTNIMRGMTFPDGLDRTLIARYAGIRPPADPAEVAHTIVYLLSDATPSLHGAIVSVDGGITAG